jgi:hypothetical protein
MTSETEVNINISVNNGSEKHAKFWISILVGGNGAR